MLVNAFSLHWNQTTYELIVVAKLPILVHDHLVTQKEVLQEFSKVINSLGFIAPVVIQAKLLMQQL